MEDAELEEAVWCAALNEETRGISKPRFSRPNTENPTEDIDRKSKGSSSGSVAGSFGDFDNDSRVIFNLHAKVDRPNAAESQTSANTIDSVFQQVAWTLQEGFNPRNRNC